MPAVSTPETSRVRWATLLVAVAVVLALLSTTALSWFQARRGAELIERAQGNQLRAAAARGLRQPGERAAWLTEFHEDQAPEGLLAIAVVEGGVVGAQAGDYDLEGLPEQLTPGEPERVGSDVVLLTKPRVRPNRSRPDGRARSDGGRRGGGRRSGVRSGPDGRSRPELLLVYQSAPADSLRAGADRTLALGWFAGLALLVLAGAVWRRSVAAEQDALELERRRHLASLGELSAVLGHEIRNPLASLKGHAQLLQRKLRDDEALEAKAALVVSEAERLERLTGRILAFARTAEAQRSPQDPAALLRSLADRIGDPRLELDFGALPTWSLDADWFPQAVENLVRNGLEASTEPVTLSARVDGRALVIDVRDHGSGFPPEQRERLFEPFHTDKVRGTGLGLAIARRVVEQHAGRIAVLDAPGGGALVRITLEPSP